MTEIGNADKWVAKQDKDGNIVGLSCNGNPVQGYEVHADYEPFKHTARIMILATDFRIVDGEETVKS